jgi:hypothetical protein
MAIYLSEPAVLDKTTLLAFVAKAIEHDLRHAWIPTLKGLVARLDAGATVAVIDRRASGATIALACAFPNSRFLGFRDESCYAAPMHGFDLIVLLDCSPDIAAARHARDTVAPGGSVLMLEPVAQDYALREAFTAAGFRRFFRVDETPFHRVFAARP